MHTQANHDLFNHFDDGKVKSQVLDVNWSLTSYKSVIIYIIEVF